jgi:hypothetical protein
VGNRLQQQAKCPTRSQQQQGQRQQTQEWQEPVGPVVLVVSSVPDLCQLRTSKQQAWAQPWTYQQQHRHLRNSSRRLHTPHSSSSSNRRLMVQAWALRRSLFPRV